MKVNISPREKRLLAGLLTFVLFLSYYLFVLEPLLARQARLQTSIADKRIEVQRLQPLEAQAPQLRQEITALESDLAALQDLGRPLHLPDVLVTLERLAETWQVELEALGLQGVVPETGGALNLRFSTQYASFSGFLLDLERLDHSFLLSSLRLASTGVAVDVDLAFSIFSGVIPPRDDILVPWRVSPFNTRR